MVTTAAGAGEALGAPPVAPEGGPSSRFRTVVRRWLPLLVLAAPAVVVLVGAWSHRWVDEDGFINLRVVDQVLAGHGPVFNEGERVEAATSPLWILTLVLGRLTLGVFLRTEWIAVVLGITATTGAFVLGAAAARRLHPRPALVVPLGLLMAAAVPVVWDYATAGLEMGLVWLWLAACWWFLVRLVVDPVPPIGGARRAALVVLGLGPLVRPDLVLTAAVLLLTWVLLARPSRRRLVADAAVAVAVPVAYEVFRMGYYASPVPNTGLAKGASTHFVFAGVDYLQDLAGTYWLWVPLIPLVLAVGTTVVRGGRAIRIAVAGMVAAGLLHGAYIVYIGGDYMHGRLLLPALFALALPGSLLVRRAVVPLVALAVGVGWAVVCAGWIRYENPEVLYVELPPITDRRTSVAADERVVRKDTVGEAIDEAEEDGLRGVLFPHVPIPIDEDGPVPSELDAAPASEADGLITFEYTIGVLGYQAGPDVRVVDLRGLADPLAARGDIFQAWRLQAGHRKFVDPEWYVARYGFDLEAWPEVTNVSAVAAARRALACPPLSELIDGVEQPLTPGRFLSNLWHAASFAGIRVPVDPRDAKGAACGTA